MGVSEGAYEGEAQCEGLGMDERVRECVDRVRTKKKKGSEEMQKR
jgi:hypothetical protein